MPNRLAKETSPYLLQHAHNPVDWYPWGPEALDRARREDKPILLSIGYSACHWCHVMERESFEDEETAQLMNEHFVNIKVDREERPDLDAIYMAAVQSMTGRGGWPMTVFLTPETLPFFGGTYFPPVDHPRMASFRRVLTAVSSAYRERRDDIEKNARQMRVLLQQHAGGGALGGPQGAATLLQPGILDSAFRVIAEAYDPAFGGFGGAPKFPQPMNLEFLLRTHHRTRHPQALQMLEHTLTCMAWGGIYDQLGGGFHRYSVDARWLVPHFEKMLYDNAQLARLYLHAYQVTGSALYRRVTEETLDYVLREMTNAAGGFYSTQDADSEGEEGKFYVWSAEEWRDVLGAEDAGILGHYYGVTWPGNFEGVNVLSVVDPEHPPPTLDAARRRLLEVRSQRVWPGLDDKVITAWNGMMLKAFAEAGAVLEREDYLEAARRNAGFVLGEMYQDGRLRRTWRDGQAKINGYLEDYANYADGLLALYEATFDLRWFQEARALAGVMCDQFYDPAGGFFDTSADHEELVNRPRDFMDNATPAGNSVAVDVLLRLARLTGVQEYEEKAAGTMRLLAVFMEQHPTAFGHMLQALDFYLQPGHEIALVGEPADDLLRVIRRPYLPHKVVALKRPGDSSEERIAVLEDREQIDGLPTAYVCQNFACQLPVTEPEALARQLGIS